VSQLFYVANQSRPLEWLATMFNAYGRSRRWIDMLEGFDFNILHRLGAKHDNVDMFSHNPIGFVEYDEDFSK
jgi:hypothetical protein